MFHQQTRSNRNFPGNLIYILIVHFRHSTNFVTAYQLTLTIEIANTIANTIHETVSHFLTTIHNYTLVQTSRSKSNISVKNIFSCQNQTLASDGTQTWQKHRLLSCLMNTSEINSKHCYRNLLLGIRNHFASQCLITVYNIKIEKFSNVKYCHYVL